MPSATEVRAAQQRRVTGHPPGTIIIAAGEFLRYGAFVNSMLQVQHPAGTRVLMKQTVSIVENFNDCIREMTGAWVWVQADDHSWHPDALTRLLDRDVDVVCPLILKRSPPYHAVAYKDFIEGQGYLPFSLAELPETGLVEVEAAGSGGMLIRRHVLEDIGMPGDAPWEDRHWFTYGDGKYLNEDLLLCRRIREADYKIHLDVEVQMGHRATFTVQPVYENGSWGIGLNLGASSNGKSNTIVVNEMKEEA